MERYTNINSKAKGLLSLCYIIRLDFEYDIQIGEQYKYEFIQKNGHSEYGLFLKKGFDETSHYALILFYNRNTREFIGSTAVNLILSPEMIDGSLDLINEYEGRWPSFHEAELNILEHTKERIILELKDGYLFDNKIILNLYNIDFEDYGNHSLSFFEDLWLTALDFYKKDGLFCIKLMKDFKIMSNTDNEDFTTDQEVYGIIRCHELEIKLLRFKRILA